MPPKVKYGFDPRAGTTGRYRGSDGRFVSEREVRLEVQRVTRGLRTEITDWTNQLRAGNLTVQQWYDGMRGLMKTGHTMAGAIANGGWKQMTPADWGKIGAITKQQYKWLNRFAQQLSSGTLILDGSVVARAGMYANAAYATYQESVRVRAIKLSYREEIRILNPSAKHCSDCEDEASKGWVPIGTLRVIGDSQCISNCQCRFDFRTRIPGMETQAFKRMEAHYV